MGARRMIPWLTYCCEECLEVLSTEDAVEVGGKLFHARHAPMEVAA